MCAPVKKIPLVNNTKVFKRGTPIGSKGMTPTGGHSNPKSELGFNLNEKNPQKNEKKNITSDKINNINPFFNPFDTNCVW